jgi:DMSO/TMAO reductase YedYZ molybdopterin-dependent catalytic subunit
MCAQGSLSQVFEPLGLGEVEKDDDAFVVHHADPVQAELKRAFMGASLVTPSALFFVRNHLAPPPVPDEPGALTIAIDGVANPGSITLAELKRMPRVVSPVVLQCAGNGRGYFPNHQSCAPWGVGAAGLGLWGGVLLNEVVARFGGPAPGMRFLTATGSEQAAPEERVERSIPIGKALRDVLLAFELNGQPLPVAHGGPVRLIVPGYYAINSVKYPSRVAFTAEESSAPIMASDYRITPVDAEAGNPSEPTCWAMNVKSWVTAPLGDSPLSPGPLTVVGVAFAGENPIQRVEVTTDGGATWDDAALVGPDLGPAAWRQFSYTFDAAPGRYILASRATDAAGNVQPEHLVPNLKGYQANGWREPAITLDIR